MQDIVQNAEQNGRPRRRAIFLLPNLITTLALFSGFVSVVASLHGDYEKAAVAILVAGLFDALDGRVARMTRTASPFGVQYDSLSDVFSFGVAPALLLYTSVLEPLGRFGWLGAFLFLACGALRLARFNIQTQKSSQKNFTGLPIPAAASLVASGVLFVGAENLSGMLPKAAVIALVYGLSLMMVSTVSYPSLKQLVVPRHKSFQVLAGVVIMLVIAANHPVPFIFFFFAAYTVLGPVIGNWVLRLIGSPEAGAMGRFDLEDEDILEDQDQERT